MWSEFINVQGLDPSPATVRVPSKMNLLPFVFVIAVVRASSSDFSISSSIVTSDSEFTEDESQNQEIANPVGNRTALHEACRSGSLEALKAALQNDYSLRCNPDARDENERTALMDICKFGHSKMLQYFLLNASEFDVCATDIRGNTPLSEAFDREDEKMVLQLYTADGAKKRLPDLPSFLRKDKVFLAKILCRACVVGESDLVEKLYERCKKK